MKSREDETELEDDYIQPEPPSMGPDGLPVHPPAPPLEMDLPPRLCDQGPCVHYHCFKVPLAAQPSIAGTVAHDDQGRSVLVGDPTPDPIRLQSHHYCYPTPGIEFPLDAPVLECNLWDPGNIYQAQIEGRRTNYLENTLAGQQFRTALDAWRERQHKLHEDEQKAIDEAMAETDRQRAELERIDRAFDACTFRVIDDEQGNKVGVCDQYPSLSYTVEDKDANVVLELEQMASQGIRILVRDCIIDQVDRGETLPTEIETPTTDTKETTL